MARLYSVALRDDRGLEAHYPDGRRASEGQVPIEIEVEGPQARSSRTRRGPVVRHPAALLTDPTRRADRP